MKKKILATLLAALMLGALAVFPAAADDAAAEKVPAGTDLFIGKNPGLENTSDDGNGGWEDSTVWDCLAMHDTADANYKPEFGTKYLHFTDAMMGTSGPQFDRLEGGRHYYLSFYVRGAKTRNDAQIVISYRKDRYDYHKMTDMEYRWPKMTELVGLIPVEEADSAKWTKLTYDIIIPPNADGFAFTLSLKNGISLDADNFSLIAGEEYISDNILKNGSFDAIRGDLDPMYWGANVGSKNVPYGTPADGNGGYCFQTNKGGSLSQNVWLETGKQYKLTFKHKNTAPGTVAFGLDGTYYLAGNDAKNQNGIYHPQVNEWESYTAVFTCPGETVGEYKAHTFNIGLDKGVSQFGGTVLFDDVVLTEADAMEVSYSVAKEVVKASNDYRIFAENHVPADGVYWQRGVDAEKVADFAVKEGAHPVKAMGYYYPKTAGEKVSMVTAVYKTVEGKKSLVSFEITEVEAADTNPVALLNTVNVPTADAENAEVESFIWNGAAGIIPVGDAFALGA